MFLEGEVHSIWVFVARRPSKMLLGRGGQRHSPHFEETLKTGLAELPTCGSDVRTTTKGAP